MVEPNYSIYIKKNKCKYFVYLLNINLKNIKYMSNLKLSQLLETERFFEDTLTLNRIGIDSDVSVYEDGDNIVMKISLPDIHPDKIDVYVKNNYLHISETKEETREEDGKAYSKEVYTESFEEMIKLPAGIKEEDMEFDLKDGELTVTLPK